MKPYHSLQNVTYLPALARLGACFFALSLWHSAPAAAAASAWIHSSGGDIRLVAARPLVDGGIPAILDIRLQPGWKTYWLEPGGSGIPPQLSFDPSSNVVFSGLRFPAPATFDDGVVRYTGYDRSVAFPLSLKRTQPTGDIILKASVFLGICKDICIPVQGDVDLVLAEDATDNPLDRARIDDALEALPQAPAADFEVVSASFDAASKRIALSLRLPSAGGAAMPELFLAGRPGYGFGKPENLRRTGDMLTAQVPVRLPAKASGLAGAPVDLVVRSGARSMETRLAFD